MKSKIEFINDPVAYLNSFSLHDVTIENIDIDLAAQKLEISVVDLNWNYEGSKEYFERRCTIIFNGAIGHFIDILDVEGVRIDCNRAQMVDGLAYVEIDLNLGGGNSSWGSNRSSISAKFGSMAIKDIIGHEN